MTALLIINMIVWGGMTGYMAWCGALNAVTGSNLRRGDPMRLACLTTGIVFLGFTVWRLLTPSNMEVLKALYVLAIVDGLFIIRLAFAYGRGPRV